MKILGYDISRKAMVVVTLVVTALLLFFLLLRQGKSSSMSPIIDGVEYVDSNKTYHKLYTDKEFNKLKDENKALYDSLKSSKKYIDYLLQFDYKKSYTSGKVNTASAKTNGSEIATDFTYESEKNDSFSYKLVINSDKEPNYYKLDVNIKDRITLVDKGSDGGNHLTIGSSNGGEISNATVYKKNESASKRILNNLSIGPSVAVGYDPFNNRFGTVVGISISYNLK